ncbi:protein phosphatase 1 regulatory subunit 15B [Gymnodraco acuticeps]|uniref:Protein phosphatase 1 regulatory subunit 15B n=1 Tax=Gymnodraco acuticeps TaxID=8218 RepID=A0A6P8VPL8_GYMAC|nr:protein phosphatase 1 regulatory subunit 15B [Gymnodraco acuticeps]
MFKSMSGDGHVSSGQSASSMAGRGGPPAGLHTQESSWLGLLSRPAMYFLQKYLPGRNEARADTGAGFMLEDLIPVPPQLTYLRCDAATGRTLPWLPADSHLEPGKSLPWLSADSMRELGIQNTDEMNQQSQMGYLSSVRTFFSHVVLNSSQEGRATSGKDWDPAGNSARGSGPWWGSFWGSEGGSGLLSDPSWEVEEGVLTAGLCPQQSPTKAPETSATLGEASGLRHKEKPADKESRETHDVVQNMEEGGSTAISLPRSEAPSCSEEAPLTPEQDHGYTSLEEEHVQVNMVNAPIEEQQDATESSPTKETSEERVEEEEEEGLSAEEEGLSAEEEGLSAEVKEGRNRCQNKAIAFIMGQPCSDNSSEGGSSSEEDDDEDDEDDDGFNSEDSSDLSDSTDDEDSERLWRYLGRSADPYDPRNFTALLHTATSPPRNIPPSSSDSSPDPSPSLLPLPLSPLAASSPPSGSDSWDDSTSASEADEAESLRLWSSFSCSDPYSPFNFQGPMRTQEPRTRTRTRKAASSSSPPNPAAPPQYRREEAEERLDSGFSELSVSSSACSVTKKVRFCEEVEEFFASGGEETEDRRGPWEQFARDRSRFLRRVQDVQLSIDYCLQPTHRHLVSLRLGTTEGN